MGHKVSTPRGGDSCPAAGAHARRAALRLLLLVAAASRPASSLVTIDGRAEAGRGSRSGDALRMSAVTASARTTLRRPRHGYHAHAYAYACASAPVPPPDSRLGRAMLRSRPGGHMRPGTKGRGGYAHGRGGGACGGGGTTGMGYARGAGALEFSLDAALGRGGGRAEDGSPSPDGGGGGPERSIRPDGPDGENPGRTRMRRRARMARFVSSRLLRPGGRGSSRKGDPGGRPSPRDPRRDYERRKAAWAAKYTTASALRRTFGPNRNRLWGDLDPPATRRLYHTLLPRALLELRGVRDGLVGCAESVLGNSTDGSPPDVVASDESLKSELKSLAPLAFRARSAAKAYARERSRLPGRVGSMLYDGLRSWRRYGTFRPGGMTWEQVWSKYEEQVLSESAGGVDGPSVPSGTDGGGERAPTDDEITARVCLRILERSVVTNTAIDRLFLRRLAEAEGEGERGDGLRDVLSDDGRRSRRRSRRALRARRRRARRIAEDLERIEREFDADVRELLRDGDLTSEAGERRRVTRGVFWRSDGGEGGGPAAVAGGGPDEANADGDMNAIEGDGGTPPDGRGGEDPEKRGGGRRLSVSEVFALRILASTKQRLSSLQSKMNG